MNIVHLGQNTTGNHNKVWGVILLKEDKTEPGYYYRVRNDYLIFWGRIGNKLRTMQKRDHPQELDYLFYVKKTDGGYTDVDIDTIEQVCPGFTEDLEKLAVWKTLSMS